MNVKPELTIRQPVPLVLLMLCSWIRHENQAVVAEPRPVLTRHETPPTRAGELRTATVFATVRKWGKTKLLSAYAKVAP